MLLNRLQQNSQPATASRTGFTLVEMLVAVALVLLMMTMFAEIFTLATGSMGKQKAIGELDQRQRMVSTVIRHDLQSRTFKRIFAIHPAELGSTSSSRNGSPSVDVPGYFYYSENTPDDDSDDVLQFTAYRSGPNDPPFYGLSRELLDTQPTPVGIAGNPNQPEYDDGDATNNIGSSPKAEIALFLRNGILYRRTLLVRVPAIANASDQPMSGAVIPVPLIQPGIYPTGTTTYVRGGNTNSRFPADFDYSAAYDYGPPNYAGTNRVQFLGNASLSNNQGLGVSKVLGLPNCRFGFVPSPNPVASRPYEYLLPSGQFIGRFTHAETSHAAFGYPGNPGLGGDQSFATADDTNPYTRTNLTLGPTGVVTINGVPPTPMTGPREGEDILLTNVLAFDVKIWDNVLGQFVDLGHSGAIGEYAQVNNHNPGYGPNPAGGNRCFDTWHPNLNPLGAAPFVITNPAPFRPVGVGDDGAPGVRTDGVPGGIGDDDGNGVDDNPEELGWPGSDDTQSPIRAIQIRIRYLELTSGLPRDITIIESLQQ